MTEQSSVFNNKYGNFNEPDMLFQKEPIPKYDADMEHFLKPINLDQKFVTPYQGYPFDQNVDISKRPNDVVLQNQNVIQAEKIQSEIYNKISSSRYQNEEINKMYDKLNRLTILKNIENNISKKKGLFDISLQDFIYIVLTDWINIFNKMFDNNYTTIEKLKYIIDYPISVGLFLLFISICVFLSFY
jgi:hypothetical protein